LCCCRAAGWWSEASPERHVFGGWPAITSDSRKPWPASISWLSRASYWPHYASYFTQVNNRL
jgi:hypothetical protein